jgi:hypothetical protein
VIKRTLNRILKNIVKGNERNCVRHRSKFISDLNFPRTSIYRFRPGVKLGAACPARALHPFRVSTKIEIQNPKQNSKQ